MTRYLLDTNILSDLMRHPEGAIAGLVVERLGAVSTSIIVAAELRFGLVKSKALHRSRRFKDLLEIIPVLPFDEPADARYGVLRAELERSGTPIGALDMLIAAHALALDCTLVTANEEEFRRVPGLRVENWLQ